MFYRSIRSIHSDPSIHFCFCWSVFILIFINTRRTHVGVFFNNFFHIFVCFFIVVSLLILDSIIKINKRNERKFIIHKKHDNVIIIIIFCVFFTLNIFIIVIFVCLFVCLSVFFFCYLKKSYMSSTCQAIRIKVLWRLSELTVMNKVFIFIFCIFIFFCFLIKKNCHFISAFSILFFRWWI